MFIYAHVIEYILTWKRWAVLRNPLYFILIIICGVGAYVTYRLNLWGPMLKMGEAASRQALDEGKRRLREFLEESDSGRQAIAMSSGDGKGNEEYEMDSLKKKGNGHNDDDDDDDGI